MQKEILVDKENERFYDSKGRQIERMDIMKKLFCLTILFVVVSMFLGGCSVGADVRLVQGDDRIDVTIDGRPFTSYLYGESLRYTRQGREQTVGKPTLYPLYSPSGIRVNRGHPLVKVEGESDEHPHHVSIIFCYDQVNGNDFWAPKPPTVVRHVKITKMTGGTGRGTLSTIIHWIDKQGKVVLEEQRTMVFIAAGQDEYAIDFDIDLIAQDTKVVFTDTKEGGFGVRVADWMREYVKKDWFGNERLGTGMYTNSQGEQSQGNTWGRRAKWVKLDANKDGKEVGIAIFHHPSSVNYPTYWHSRGYGLFMANPLGQLAFQKGRKVENPTALNLTLQPGQKAHFGFRLLVYDGPRTSDQIEQRFYEFAKN